MTRLGERVGAPRRAVSLVPDGGNVTVGLKGSQRPVECGTLNPGIGQSVSREALGDLIAIGSLLLLEYPQHDRLNKPRHIAHRACAGVTHRGLPASARPGIAGGPTHSCG